MAVTNGGKQGKKTGAGNGGMIPPPEYRWKKGQSGNPKGRPKEPVSLVRALRKHLREHPEEVDEIIANWCEQARRGNERALGFIRLLAERIDGLVPQSMTLTGTDGGPVELDLSFHENGRKGGS